jgi:chemotaxis-related protein WspD
MPNHDGRRQSGQATGTASAAIHRLLDRPLTPAALDEATQAVARPIASPEQRVASLLLFKLRGECFALPITCIQRVTLPVRVHTIPHRTNRVIRGLCHLGGELLISVDLANLLEIAPQLETGPSPSRPRSPAGRPRSHPPNLQERPDNDARRMIVITQSGRAWAADVDRVLGNVQIELAAYKPLPITVQQARKRFTSNLLAVDGGLAGLLDVERLFDGLEASLS